MKNKVLKKAISLMMLLIMCFMLPGCSKATTPTNEVTAKDSQETIDSLLALIDETESFSSSNMDEWTSMETENDQYFEDVLTVVQNRYDKIKEFHSNADSLEIQDEKLRKMVGDYYNLLETSSVKVVDIYDFAITYFSISEECSENIGSVSDNLSVEEQVNEILSYTSDYSDKVNSVSDVPFCAQTEWEKYKDALELDMYALIKEKEAYNTENDKELDILGIHSAENLLSRANALMRKSSDKLLGLVLNEASFLGKQIGQATVISKDITNYCSLENSDKQAFEYLNDPNGVLDIDYEAIEDIYPALYNTYDSFLIIKGGSLLGEKQIVVEMEIPGLTQAYKQTITLDPSYNAVYIKPPAVVGELNLDSSKSGQMSCSIYESDGSTLIETQNFPVNIKSKNDFVWYDDDFGLATRDNILCFMTPESKAINELKRDAIDEMSDMTNGSVQSFPGYQTYADWNEETLTYMQIASVMRALNTRGVRYNLDGFSISEGSQHILFPEEALDQKSALCIESSLIVASALVSADMHVYLVFPEGHAQVAVETWNENGEGSRNYFLVETTCLDDSKNNRDIYIKGANDLLSYIRTSDYPIIYFSNEEWEYYLENEVIYEIDCNEAGLLGMTPFVN